MMKIKNIFFIMINSINWKYKFLPKDRGVPHQKSVEVTKLKLITKVTLFNQYASKISLRNLNIVIIYILLDILVRQQCCHRLSSRWIFSNL